MKKIVSMLIAAAVVLGLGLSRARAAEPKPIAAVAVAGYNDIIGNINYVGSLVNRPQLGAAADGFVSLVTQFKGLTGVDKTRPWGAIVQAGGEEDIVGYVCVPVTDFKAALELLELYNTVDAQGEIYKLTPKTGDKTTYVKKHGDWACFSDKAESLAHIATDPLSALSNLEKNYIVAGKIFFRNVPESLHQKAIEKFKEGFEREDADKKDDESDAQFAQRKKFRDQFETYAVRVFGDLDEVSFGWALDRKAGNTYVDLNVTAKSGTTTAQELALAAESKTNFAGFRLPDAMFTASIAGVIPPAKQEIALGFIGMVRGKVLGDIEKNTPENKREAVKSAAGDVLDLLTKIVKSGRVDAVVTNLISPKAATQLVAIYVADGQLFDKLLHAVVSAIEEDHPEVAQFIKLDAETVDGHQVHKISIPIPQEAENRDKLVQLIGEKLDIVIAVGKENVYIADGRDAGAKLKKAVEASSKAGAKPVTPVSASLDIKPIAGLVTVIGKPHEQKTAAMVEAELKKTAGKNHITFTVRPISNGVQVRLEVEQGLVRLAGRLAAMKIEGKHLPGEEGDKE